MPTYLTVEPNDAEVANEDHLNKMVEDARLRYRSYVALFGESVQVNRAWEHFRFWINSRQDYWEKGY